MRVSTQTGVGLIEVMVAVLLLSVAVLGFSALQLRAISATDESLVRTQTLSIIRGLAENMRANAQEIDTYEATINNTATSYVTCTDGCTAEQIAINEAKTAYDRLSSHGVTMSMVTCPGTANFSQVMCIIAAWGDTLPMMNATNDKACANEDGIYKSGNTCMIVETY